jgi:hypothetical protein
MFDGDMLIINAPKDAVSVYWDNNLRFLNSFVDNRRHFFALSG